MQPCSRDRDTEQQKKYGYLVTMPRNSQIFCSWSASSSFPVHATKLNPNGLHNKDQTQAACEEAKAKEGCPGRVGGQPSGSPLAPLARLVFSVGEESNVATVFPLALVIGAVELGPFALNSCLPGLYTGGVGYTGASTHWFGT